MSQYETYPYYPLKTYGSVLKTVQNCEAVCENTLTAVLGMHNVHTRIHQIQLLRDCADICTLTAKYIARCSMFARYLANLCADICEICGKHCLMHHDAQSQYCGKVCLDCARECRDFAGKTMNYPDYDHDMPMSEMYSKPKKKDKKK